MKLSKNFSLIEFTKSQTAIRKGIDNKPTNLHLASLTVLCNEILQPLRDWYLKPITINSGYRSEELNKAIGGSKTSQHCKGQAADIDTVSDNIKLFFYIKDNLEYDQLLAEFEQDGNIAWIHVSYNPSGINRNETRIARKVNGKTEYPFYTAELFNEIYTY